MTYPITGTAYAYDCLKSSDRNNTVKYAFRFYLRRPKIDRTIECTAYGRDAIELSGLLNSEGRKISLDGYFFIRPDDSHSQECLDECCIHPRVKELRAQGIDTWVCD